MTRVSVCLPAGNEEATIGAALAPLIRLLDSGEISQLVVVEESEDRTADIAETAGATVYRQSQLRSDLGPVLGKGDALWRSLGVLYGEILVFLDADSTTIGAHYVRDLVAPIREGHADLVKGHYHRRLGSDPDGGGRVNHLVARPLLHALLPHATALHEIRQPLAGETAITRELAFRLPFETGYGIEIGLLLDAHDAGARIAQVDLREHDHRHRSIPDLAETAEAVMRVILDRAGTRPSESVRRGPVDPSLYERAIEELWA